MSAIEDGRPNFEGHPGRECGEHRTVGPHRAWCYDCAEWCYPSAPCARCERPLLFAAIHEAADHIAAMAEGMHLTRHPERDISWRECRRGYCREAAAFAERLEAVQP